MADDNDYNGFGTRDDDIIIGRYRLICTCGACPEQYDVFDELTKQQVGYLRLRHGFFRADLYDCGGETVYESNPKGDGVFDEDERMPELTKAIAAIDAGLVARGRDE
jgi:hypothetical protein